MRKAQNTIRLCTYQPEGVVAGVVVVWLVVGAVLPVVVVVEPPVGPEAMQEPVPRAVAQSIGALEAKRWRRAWTSNAAGLGLPLESKRVPAPAVPIQDWSSRVSQLMNSLQLDAYRQA